MKFGRVVFLSAFVAIGLASKSSANEINACLAHPQFGPPFETGQMIVSTFHLTGVPGSERLIDLTWPATRLVKLSGSPPGRIEKRTLLFEFDGSSKLRETGFPLVDEAEFPDFSLLVTAVEKLPLYSSLGAKGGLPFPRAMLRHVEGYTYQSSEGLEIIPNEVFDKWREFIYPGATPRRDSNDRNWFRGAPAVGEVEAILTCRDNNGNGLNGCTIEKKIEPLSYNINLFSEINPTSNQISQLEAIADRFVNCLIQGF